MIKKLSYLLSLQDKKFLLILFLMSIFLSLVETVGIAAIMPFISIASNPELIHSNDYLTMLYAFFAPSSNKNFIIYFGVSLIVFYF